MECCAQPIDFGSFTKHPSERLRCEFNWFDNLANFWRHKFYRAGDIVRPTRSTGFAYRALADGTSGFREPRWRTLSNTHDGSVTWEPIPANFEGVDIIVSATVAAPSGVTVGSPSWEGSTAFCSIEGGDEGTDYQLECEVTTLSGQRLVGVLEVKARAERCN